MDADPKIPFGYKRVPDGQTQRGDAFWNGIKFQRVRKVDGKWPVMSVVVIRRCTVEQPELPGVSDARP